MIEEVCHKIVVKDFVLEIGVSSSSSPGSRTASLSCETASRKAQHENDTQAGEASSPLQDMANAPRLFLPPYAES